MTVRNVTTQKGIYESHVRAEMDKLRFVEHLGQRPDGSTRLRVRHGVNANI